MNNRRNYAYFGDLLRGMQDSAVTSIETRISAADPAEYGFRREQDYGTEDRDDGRNYAAAIE